MTDETGAPVEDAPETEQTEEGAPVAVAEHKPYMEREDWVPSALDMIGNVDTTGTGGAAAQSVQQVSPVFAQARADALSAAVDAVDNHPQGNPDSVVLPMDGKSYADAVDELKAAAEVAVNDPQLTSGLTPGQVEGMQPGEPVNPNAPAESETAAETEGGEVKDPADDSENPPA